MDNYSVKINGTEYTVSSLSDASFVEGFLNKEVKYTVFEEAIQYDSWHNRYYCACSLNKIYKYNASLSRIKEVKLPKIKGAKELDDYKNLEIFVNEQGAFLVRAGFVPKEALHAALEKGCFYLEVSLNNRELTEKENAHLVPNDIEFNQNEFNSNLQKILDNAVEEAKNKYFLENSVN